MCKVSVIRQLFKHVYRSVYLAAGGAFPVAIALLRLLVKMRQYRALTLRTKCFFAAPEFFHKCDFRFSAICVHLLTPFRFQARKQTAAPFNYLFSFQKSFAPKHPDKTPWNVNKNFCHHPKTCCKRKIVVWISPKYDIGNMEWAKQVFQPYRKNEGNEWQNNNSFWKFCAQHHSCAKRNANKPQQIMQHSFPSCLQCPAKNAQLREGIDFNVAVIRVL